MMDFFKKSEYLEYFVLRPLSHIYSNWDLIWDDENNKYEEEEDSFASILNNLISELETTEPPPSYHDNEDILAEYVVKNLTWDIKKQGKRWVCPDYPSVLEQGGFNDIDEANLVLAAAGRIKAAEHFGQNHFDEMEKGHQKIFGYIIAIILYHRYLNRA
jgi:hypothetical protein